MAKYTTKSLTTTSAIVRGFIPSTEKVEERCAIINGEPKNDGEIFAAVMGADFVPFKVMEKSTITEKRGMLTEDFIKNAEKVTETWKAAKGTDYMFRTVCASKIALSLFNPITEAITVSERVIDGKWDNNEIPEILENLNKGIRHGFDKYAFSAYVAGIIESKYAMTIDKFRAFSVKVDDTEETEE